MRVGFHSPLPPARTGVADYAWALLKSLQKCGDVRPNPAKSDRMDVHLYHIGNNQLHRKIYEQAIEHPGVVVLHDAVLQHLFLGWLTETAYQNEFVFNYSEWNRETARRLWRDRAASATDERYFRYPMLKRLASCSRAIIVHNPGAADLVRQHVPEARIAIIPHIYDPPPVIDPASSLEFRHALGIPPDAYLFGVFGFLRESKRLFQVLEVFANAQSANPRIALLIAGEFVSTDLLRACRELLASPQIYRAPYLSGPDFAIAASAVDACINLRIPSAGETSGIAIRMMGLGKPILLTDSPENMTFPKGSFLPVPSGVAERATLLDYICILPSSRVLSGEIGRMASDHIGREHSITRVSGMYWNLLCANVGP